MKVRCTRIFGVDGAEKPSSPWLTIGRVYDVLTVELQRSGRWHVRLLGDQELEPALYEINAFEVISHDLPPSWVASWTSDGFFELAPKAWLDPQFWERFYDREPEAVKIFQAALAEIKATS